MKKIYITLFSLIAFGSFSQSNLTLTRAAQEPVAGDIHTVKDYDSVSVIPKSIGLNQNWDFSSIIQTTDAAYSTTFVAASTVPSASLFPGATLAEDDGYGDYTFYKSATTPTTQWEMLGSAYSGATTSGMNYSTNSIINMVWPMASGNYFNDTYTGSIFGTSGVVGGETGSQTVTSMGSGTIIMPGGAVYSNVIQIRTVQKVNTSFTYSGTPVTYTDTYTIYDYYHASQKFPLLTVNYDSYKDATSSDLSCYITVNKVITVGLKDEKFDNSFSIFPNPAKDKITFQINNVNAEKCSLEIMTITGQQVMLMEYGSTSFIKDKIDISKLQKGVYFLKTTLGSKTQAQKLLVE